MSSIRGILPQISQAVFRRQLPWLKACSIKTVAMESTGVFWIPLFQVLDERGSEVRLVDALI